MSSEIDDKTRAQVLREYAEEKRVSEQSSLDDLTISVSEIEEDANLYDPPSPQIESGTLTYADLNVDGTGVVGYYGRSGLYSDKDLSRLIYERHEIHSIRPVRTLGPTQQTVTIPHPREWPKGETMCEVVITFTGRRNMLRVQKVVEIDEAHRMWEE